MSGSLDDGHTGRQKIGPVPHTYLIRIGSIKLKLRIRFTFSLNLPNTKR